MAEEEATQLNPQYEAAYEEHYNAVLALTEFEIHHGIYTPSDKNKHEIGTKRDYKYLQGIVKETGTILAEMPNV
jgi:hypothetical protein